MPRENGQIRHSNAARTAWIAGSHPHRASALHPVQETAIIPVCSGLIRGIPEQRCIGTVIPKVIAAGRAKTADRAGGKNSLAVCGLLRSSSLASYHAVGLF